MMEFQCRTCLAIRDPKQSFSLDEILLGRTLRRIIFPFLPDNNMVLSFLVRDVICCNCYQILKTFAQFIERCIEVENTLKKVNNDIIACNGVTIHVPESNCAPKENHTAFTNNGSKLVDVEKQQKKPESIVEDLPELQDHCYFSSGKSIRTYSSKSNKTLPVTAQIEEVQAEKPNGTSNNVEINNSETETVENDSDVSWSIDRVTKEWMSNKGDTEGTEIDSDIYWTADGETYQLKTIGTNTPYKLPVLDSLDHYQIEEHDRTITVAQPGDTFPELLNSFADNGLNLVQIDFPMRVPSNTRKKRLLLFGSIVIRCPECHIQLDSRDELELHHESMHPDGMCLPKPEKEMFDEFISKKKRLNNCCPVCRKSFAMKAMLTQHLQRAHKDYLPYKCRKCGKKFRMKSTYETHMKKYGNLENCNYRKCGVCKEMIHEDKLVGHMKSHRHITCEECGKPFATIAHLNSHKKTHEKNSEKHLCPSCGKLFNCSANLKAHMRTHETVSSEKSYMCDKCAKVYATPLRLHWHVRKVHVQKKQFECPLCKKKCSTSTALNSHKKLKHSTERSHTCPVCGQQFVRGDYYRRHMKWHQNAEGKGRGVTGSGGKRYLRSKFYSPRCKYCSKLFKNLYLLRQHLISHVKTIRYKCRSCSMTFANMTNRYRHEKRHKDPNFELSCKVCWKRMETKEELEVHHAKHVMNRKYQCGECGELLSSKYYFRHHMSEKHITKEDVEKEKSTVLEDALKEFLL